MLSGILAEKYPSLLVFDTICGATKERQSDLVQLVEGRSHYGDWGKHSANTKKLAGLALYDKPTFHVETSEDIKPEKFNDFKTVGVTAGASSEFIIRSICEKRQSLEKRMNLDLPNVLAELTSPSMKTCGPPPEK